MPRVILVPHESLLQRPLFEIADDVEVTSLACLSTASPSVRPATINTRQAFSRRGVVRRAGLQTDRLAWIEMARYPLYSSRNTTLLLLHC